MIGGGRKLKERKAREVKVGEVKGKVRRRRHA